MAPMKHGVGMYSATAVVVTVVFFAMPYLLGHDVSGGLSKMSIIRGAAKDDPKFPGVKLTDVLARAATPDKTVIITSLNDAWAQNNTMIDVFLESFRSGENIIHLIDHLVVVCVDDKAYERCTALHRHCFRMGSAAGKEFAGERVFMTEGFVQMMWRRIQFLGEVLELGYSFIFSDGDILWFRDPFKVFTSNIDVQLSTDHYQGSPFDRHKQFPNSGFMYVRSNNRTIEMYKYWYEARIRNPGKNDQHVLKSILEEEEFAARVNVTVKFYKPVYFSGFCTVSEDMRKVVTMHSNCCVGLSNKLNDLHLALDDWRMYKNASRKGNVTGQNTWRAPSACIESLERLAPWAL